MIDVATIDLKKGNHASRDAGMCAMELVAYIAGEPHSDHPACACSVITRMMTECNDAWDDETRNRLLRPLVLRVVGTRSTPEVERERAMMALDWLIRDYASAWLELVPALKPDAAVLKALLEVVDLETAKVAGAVMPGIKERSAAAWAAAGAAAGDAAWAAAWAAAWDAAWAAAGDAAGAAAGAAARDALKPTTQKLQESAAQLIERMIAVTE